MPCSHFAVMNDIQNLYDGNISILKKAALGSRSWPRLLWLPWLVVTLVTLVALFFNARLKLDSETRRRLLLGGLSFVSSFVFK